MNPKLYELRISDFIAENPWISGYEDTIILDKVEKKFFRELIEICNQTHEQLHGEAARAAQEILKPTEVGYESIFGLKKGKVL